MQRVVLVIVWKSTVYSAWMFCALGISLIPNVSLPRMLLPEQVLLSSHAHGRGKNQAQNSNSSVLCCPFLLSNLEMLLMLLEEENAVSLACVLGTD